LVVRNAGITYNTLVKEGRIDGYAKYDNNVPKGQRPILIEAEGLTERVSVFTRGLARGELGGGVRGGRETEGTRESFQKGQEGPLGSFNAGDPTNLQMKLFEGSDLSTLLHESRHMFVHLMGVMSALPGTTPYQLAGGSSVDSGAKHRKG
jgi:hypothetical protein